MNLFEDLIDELKEDNLLEETVIDTGEINRNEPSETVSEIDVTATATTTPEPSYSFDENETAKTADQSDNPIEDPVTNKLADELQEVPVGKIYNTGSLKDALVYPEKNLSVEAEINEPDLEESIEVREVNVDREASIIDDELSSEVRAESIQPIINQEEPAPKVDPSKAKTLEKDAEFYRRRALDEVNGLEMVEHVLSGVQREMMKTVPNMYDAVDVKQALYDFLQIVEDTNSSNHAESEFGLMQETEKWYSVLAEKDKGISVQNLRRYCETTKPSLSSQALMSLAKFYRNSPYSEKVRSKFDLVITKLFSKDIEYQKRELVFEAAELVKHIQELYADWSSVPLYSTDENDSELLLSALKFQDFISEAESAESFDELVKKDFFKRLKQFKEKTNENFFAPILVAAGVESNVVIGNRFIDLIEQGRDSEEKGTLSNKYGVVHDRSISEATSKTLELLEILKERKSTISDNEKARGGKKETKKRTSGRPTDKSIFGARIPLIALTIIVILIGTVYFVTSGTTSSNDANSDMSEDVKVVNLENSSLKEYVESARISGKTLFAITKENWVNTEFTDKEEVVEKFLQTGKEKGFTNVHFLNSDGETVAFGSKEGVNIIQ